jgi:hypothetical protein
VVAVPESVLWPDAPGMAYGTSELVGIYTTRRELSPATVGSLLDAANRNVDVLAYAALWLWDAVPNFAERLAMKASSGVSVRICLGDPECDAVKLRGKEEGVGDGIANRCRLAASYVAAVQQVDGDTVRKTDTILYASLLRFDDEVLVNSHFWGNPASDSPVFHFRQRGAGGIATAALRSFDRVWEQAQPLSAG